MRSRVELFENIRKDWRLGEPSIRELAERHKVHRRTVRQALADAVPPPRKVYPSIVAGSFKAGSELVFLVPSVRFELTLHGF